MKIFICSDLHMEFQIPHVTYYKDIIKSFPEADVIVLAGDIGTEKELAAVIPLIAQKYKRVLHVAGNHEYYGSSLYNTNYFLEELSLAIPNYHFLNREAVKIDGIEFIGATLWFPEDPLNVLYKQYMNDFRKIKDAEDPHTGIYARNKADMQFLDKNVTHKSIVITHHLPSYQSVPLYYKGNDLNRFYVCDMEKLILDRQPKAWIHGHGHEYQNYEIGETKIICNPLGYPNEKTGFKNLILEV